MVQKKLKMSLCLERTLQEDHQILAAILLKDQNIILIFSRYILKWTLNWHQRLIKDHLPIWNWSLATSVSAPSFSLGSTPMAWWLVCDKTHSPTKKYHIEIIPKWVIFPTHHIQHQGCDRLAPCGLSCYDTSKAPRHPCEGKVEHLLWSIVVDLFWSIEPIGQNLTKKRPWFMDSDTTHLPSPSVS